MNIIYMLHPKNTVDYLFCDESVYSGLEKFQNCGYTALPVIDRNGIYVGTVSEGDFLRCILEKKAFTAEDQEIYSVSGIIRKGWNPPIKVTAPMDELLLQVMDQNFLPVVDDRGCFAGIVTRKDIIKYFYDRAKCESA